MHVLSFAVILAVVPASAANDAQKDLKRMQGEWKITKAVKEGKTIEGESLKSMQAVVKGNNITITRDGTSEQAEIALDPAAKPPALDLRVSKDRVVYGIYQLEGEKLRIIFTLEGKETRPKDFTPGPRTGFYILEREKK